MKKIIVAFDVDGTLIHQAGPKADTPRYDVIQLYKILESLGCDMWIWSGGGVDYAQRWADKLGLRAQISAKGNMRPDIAVDDFPSDDPYLSPTLGVINLKV